MKELGQDYAIVIKMLGGRKLIAKCTDGLDRIGLIRGAMRKRVWISPGDYVLISLRNFSEKCVDVIHKYDDVDVSILRKKGELNDLSNKDAWVTIEDEPLAEETFDFEEL